MPLTLEYTVTRKFKWRWFGPVSVLAAFIVFIVLIVINIPLTGYETVTTFQNDFNATDSLWFYNFMPFNRPAPGSLCDPHLFNVGDSFTTNYSFFQWNIDTIVKPNAGASSISYSGTPLTFCDVSSVYLNGDLRSSSVDYTVVVACQQENMFEITAKTSFSMSNLPGVYSPLLGVTRYLDAGTIDARGVILDYLILLASTDLGTRTYNAFVGSNSSAPAVISLQAEFPFCPLSLGLGAECAVNPPKFNISSAAVIYNNLTVEFYDSTSNISDTNPWVLDDDNETPLHNILEAVYAAIRIDLGNPSFNNFILNRTVINSTINSTFPATPYNSNAASRNSTLYALWSNPPDNLAAVLPVNVSGPAQIQLVYPCRFQQRKKFLGSLVISVIVATLSMFSAGWTVYILVATTLAKRQDALANRCDGHFPGRQGLLERSSSLFDGYDTYGLQQTEYSPPDPPKDHVYQKLVD